MGVIFITILDVVVQCMGFHWCQQYSYVSFRQLLINGSLELMLEVPVIIGAKTIIAKIKIYRRKEGEYINDNDAGGR